MIIQRHLILLVSGLFFRNIELLLTSYCIALHEVAEFASVQAIYGPSSLPQFSTTDGYIVPSLQVSSSHG